MSDTFQCGDNPALVGYLYDECEASERAAIAAHVAMCAACAAELAALESTRVRLASWEPPETELGFAVVRPHASGLRNQKERSDRRAGAWALRPGTWFVPAWAQAAAAVAIFGDGLWLGVQRGTITDPAPANAAVAMPAASAPAVSADQLSALEQRLRGEIAAIRTASGSVSAPAAVSESELMARVRALIDESEQRQQRELAFRTAQIMRDVDSQRRVDLAQIQRNFGQIEGLTGAEVREQRQMLDYLIRVSQQGR